MRVVVLLAAGSATALATGLGAVPGFLLGERGVALRPALWGLASGLMILASIDVLLLTAADNGSAGRWWPASRWERCSSALPSSRLVAATSPARGDRTGAQGLH